MKFNSRVEKIGSIKERFDQLTIESEPMLFRCDLEHSLKYGGIITKCFIESLPKEWIEDESMIIDSRVHMLMKGWYPCIPGFHHDDVPRFGNQPDYNNRYETEHILCLVGEEICPTVFAVGEANMKPVPEGEVIYKQWHQEIEEQISQGKLSRIEIESYNLYKFDCYSFHSGQPSKGKGWRWFGRASIKSAERFPVNKVRRQTQVYLDCINNGW